MNGDILTLNTYSNHAKHSVVCNCKYFIETLRQKKMTWHYYHWWKTAKTSARYQFLFHHIGFNVTRSRLKGKKLPPAHIANLTIPGSCRSYVICAKQFFFVIGKNLENYRTVIRRVWRDTFELNLHDTDWKPSRKRESKWFNYFRSEFPK